MLTASWYEVSVRSVIGAQLSLRADSQEDANAIGREVFGDDVLSAMDLTGIPQYAAADASVVYAGRTRERHPRREWLVRYHDREVHVYEDPTEIGPRALFPRCRFRANVPGYGATGWTVWDAVRGVSHRASSLATERVAWMTEDVRAGIPYLATGYQPAAVEA